MNNWYGNNWGWNGGFGWGMNNWYGNNWGMNNWGWNGNMAGNELWFWLEWLE
jgi:hypothetical protein